MPLDAIVNCRWYRFQTLARWFLDGYNPKPKNYPGVLDAILSFPPELVPALDCGRYFAKDFAMAATQAIDNADEPVKWLVETDGGDHPKIVAWLRKWVIENTPSKLGREPDQHAGYGDD